MKAQLVRRNYVVSVTHANNTMMYTVRRVSRKQALQLAILKYPNSQYIHVGEVS